MGFVLLGCSKSIDIEYRQTTQQTDNSLIGVWDGSLNCPSCEDDRYRYTLTIETHENQTASGTLKITKIPEQQDYILFGASISINNNTLEVVTTDTREEFTSVTSVFWCKDNKYVLQLSSNRIALAGEWISSGNCSVFSNSNTIEINKQ